MLVRGCRVHDTPLVYVVHFPNKILDAFVMNSLLRTPTGTKPSLPAWAQTNLTWGEAGRADPTDNNRCTNIPTTTRFFLYKPREKRKERSL